MNKNRISVLQEDLSAVIGSAIPKYDRNNVWILTNFASNLTS